MEHAFDSDRIETPGGPIDIARNRGVMRELMSKRMDSLTPRERALRLAMEMQIQGVAELLGDELLRGGRRRSARSIIIKPVGYGCNYRCDYCFHREVLEHLDFMPIEVVQTIFENAKATLGSDVKFFWHGGEPTLAGLPFFERAMELQRSIFGALGTNIIQTNGSTMDSDWVDFLARNRFAIGISLDGSSTYNHHRKAAGGQGTSARTLRAMEMLRDRGLRFGIIAVVSAGNGDAVDLLDTARSAGASQLFTVPATQDTNCAPTAEAYGRFVVELMDLWLSGGGEPPYVTHVADYFGSLIGGAQSNCRLAGTCSHFLTIQRDGKVKACCDRNTDPIRHPETYVGTVHADGGLGAVLRSQAFRAFEQVANSNPVTCQGCRWLSVCKGGCSHERLMAGGALGSHDPQCRAYMRGFSFMQSCIDEVAVAHGI